MTIMLTRFLFSFQNKKFHHIQKLVGNLCLMIQVIISMIIIIIIIIIIILLSMNQSKNIMLYLVKKILSVIIMRGVNNYFSYRCLCFIDSTVALKARLVLISRYAITSICYVF